MPIVRRGIGACFAFGCALLRDITSLPLASLRLVKLPCSSYDPYWFVPFLGAMVLLSLCSALSSRARRSDVLPVRLDSPLSLVMLLLLCFIAAALLRALSLASKLLCVHVSRVSTIRGIVRFRASRRSLIMGVQKTPGAESSGISRNIQDDHLQRLHLLWRGNLSRPIGKLPTVTT